MELIQPRDITLNSSNVSEGLHNEWDSSTTYSSGDRVYVTLESDGNTERTPHQIYESLADSNTDNYPPENPSQWSLIGATNRWAMFDDFVSSQTVNTNTIEVTIGATKADRIALFQLEGQSVTIVTKDSGGTVISDNTVDLTISESVSWSDYFFSEIRRRSELVRELPGLFLDIKVELTVTAASGEEAKCGNAVLGKAAFLGTTQFGVSAGIEDFSRKETNEFGETAITKRAFAKLVDADLWIPTSSDGREFNRVQSILARIRSTPVVWQFNNDDTSLEPLIVFGFYRDFDLVAQFPTLNQCNIEVEGLI